MKTQQIQLEELTREQLINETRKRFKGEDPFIYLTDKQINHNTNEELLFRLKYN